MAKFVLGNFDDILNEINLTPELGKEMVETGCQQALDAVLLNTPARSGDLRASIYRTGAHVDKDGNWYDNIHAKDYDRFNIPNPLKANVLEVGRENNGKVAARHFLRKAMKSAQPRIESAMREVFEKRTGIKNDS